MRKRGFAYYFFSNGSYGIRERWNGESGGAAYFVVQIENDGKKGPWGALVSALIP